MTISVEIKYFVAFDRLMGKTEKFPFEGERTAQGLCQALAAKYPGFSRPDLFDRLIVLRNGSVCRPADPLEDGDEISFLTPLVGG